MTRAITWVALDWGTSNLRAWLMDDAGDVIDTLRADKGMGVLHPDQFEPVLIDLIAPVLRDDVVLPVIACGMVGAKQGWAQAPYIPVPAPPPDAQRAIQPDVRDARISVHILPGLCQSQPPDVMRGEETQIAGFLAQNPSFDGTICLPGTHSKWVQISAGEIVSFRTFMSGELYQTLSQHSVLRHSVGDGWDCDAFAHSVTDAMMNPLMISNRLFALRAAGLLDGLSVPSATARLSGLLLGLELGGARAYWLGQQVVLIGTTSLIDHYDTALRAQGVDPIKTSGDDLVRLGLTRAYNNLIKGA